jgi:hypothetical protein
MSITLGPMAPGLTAISTCVLSTISVPELALMTGGPFW